jgi:hypothetical protein
VKHIEEMCENGTLCFKMFQSFLTVREVWWMKACDVILQRAHCVLFSHICFKCFRVSLP